MKITLKTFAQLREKTGRGQIELELPEQATLETCLKAFLQQFPELEQDLKHTRLALNQRYVRDLTTPLKTNDEVALIPPVSGG
ncbi:molybdopterin converting factor subunit 1 [bacterium (Candidatus Blackallbacteria) CG17_big_fil_post_rev_8_21_14_2_50_48_46]|uniref:Molybdopterin synthase sulfur carrier subunit n=1 Tax=bacterium (Candidatus Blackallbacteria) CG17_big_fil_post_rev_8_21_14_2_50_48_46 TaxID=2014261 RepID=A0A2M7G045_9BACT|nr:MAG: molybdopterin converting factor subunit 1 [bacterium (Candidatus Blackallbacteria) CG18_big_fil_WC_8_21_14_2_50_49_26]PIW15066.1 MAG: molybdopterin converting factor subunit 1 [bacterium (Candidatus Blackallbacteria) CG17_big_fil_post_rev_8_21_14_2_50_48_46]PIW47611.1 MAG: molybdopterin converting factor subunit 1 [bacterium (Candidatus Blackallbacteria) CG13_big_fil_rev_8_21_14_2_50_49_14]